MPLRFVPMPTAPSAALPRAARPTPTARRRKSVSRRRAAAPCRHCLRPIASGERYLLAGYRPFPEPQPYAEIGPIFLHAEMCPSYGERRRAAADPRTEGHCIIRGYGRDDRIVYGSGQGRHECDRLRSEADGLFDDARIAYIHVRSANQQLLPVPDRPRLSLSALRRRR